MNSSSPSPDSQPWSAFSGGWSLLGPPLRPCPEDLERIHQAWRQSLPSGLPARRVEILCLGVTPEIARFPWAPEFHLTAVDASAEMIERVWPGNGPNRQAVLSDWLDLPFADGAFDLILTDAGLTPVVGTEGLRAVAGELCRVLRKDGRIAMRHFARPSPPQTLDEIVGAAAAGRLQNFHELKMRLLMAMESEKGEAGVRLAEVHERFQQLFPDRDRLASQLRCDPRTVGTIDAYRGREAHYSFHSLDEMAQAFSDFTLTPAPPGQYPATGICPVFSLTPKA